jgi:3,5-epimerase/4-reductase
MKFLVWGYKGWIGGQVMDTLKAQGHEAIGASSRADQEDAVAAELDAVKPDRCICLIGRTRGEGFLTIDYLEQKGKLKENVQDNLWGPIVIAFQASTRGIHTTYMGTGCIFHFDDDKHLMKDGTNGVGFTEDDNANFFGSAYSTVKGFTDRLMRMMFATKVLNVRIRMPITADDSPYNFITKIVNYDKVVNIPNSMTVLPALIPMMCDMAAKEVPGTVNLTHPGAISHNEVLELYKKHVDPSYTYQNFTIEEQDKILLSGRSNNLLDTKRLKELYPDVDDIHTAVEKVCVAMKAACPNGLKKPKPAPAANC